MVSIARKNLFEDLPRFLVAQAGIMLAVSLVTIQTGILEGFTRSTTLLIDYSAADLWVADVEMVHLELTKPLLFRQVNIAQKVNGVQKAEPLIMGGGLWLTPKGQLTPLRTFGFDPEGELFRPQTTAGSLRELKQPYTVMVDESKLNSLNVQIGSSAQIRSLPAKLVAITQNTQSIASSSVVFTSLENANAYIYSAFSSKLDCKLEEEGVNCTTIYEKSDKADSFELAENLETPEPLSSTDAIAYILIKAKPGQDLEVLKQKLEAALPGTRAYTTAEMSKKTGDFWEKRTGVGFILGLGATVGVIVGMVIVGQILYTSVSDHIKEFGTLKAMGAPDGVIYGSIVEQSLWMAVLGYIPSMVLCLGLSYWALATEGVIILITPLSAVGIFAITVVMCVGAALFAIQKVTWVDPAIVFKA
ncbi:MAG: ABC transporter permease [Prochloron sp. SP5CPC1]|nr:ABC transporter permease [Candidatus Paraprochloron terpiosi SP5CPC1]